MYKIAVMGDRDSVMGFASIGIEVIVATDEKPAAEKLKELAHKDYAVVYITEALAEILKEEIEKYKDCISPAIILIPGVSGNTGEGMSGLTRSVERAVGTQLLD